jgi:death-on-curing protein
MTWRWLNEAVVVAMHDEQIAEHGGLENVRDAGLLTSALARPRNQAAHGDPDVFDLAAAQAFGIIRDHPFLDGNKRTGFLAACVFLDLNGWELNASEAEAVAAVLALATGEMEEAEFSAWLREQSVSRE